MTTVLWVISITIWIYFLYKTNWKTKQDNQNRSKVEDLLHDWEVNGLDKFFCAGYVLTNLWILSEWFWFLFIIYWLDLIFLR